MLATAFDPAKSGFRFRNGTFKTHVGSVNCSVLCGGMAYAVLDYVYTENGDTITKRLPR